MIAGWREVVEAVLDAPGTVVVLGPVDAGKTTAAAALANAALRAGCPAAILDADPGQSDIGPPTVVGLGVPRRPVRTMGAVPLVAGYFVGDTSARESDPLVREGTARLAARAGALGAAVIVVDTTGWVEGPPAVFAKVRLVARLRPRHLVAIQRAGEVEPILARLPPGPAVHRLRPSPLARRRPPAERRAFRERRFARYFARAERLALDAAVLRCERDVVHAARRVPAARVLDVVPAPALRHLLVGLADGAGDLLAVGILDAVRGPGARLDVIAPLGSPAGIEILQWGALRVAPSGREEGRLAGAA